MFTKRNLVILGCATALAGCGGGTGPQTVGGSAPPTAGGSATPEDTHSFVNPTEAKTYDAIGAVHHYEYSTDSTNRGQYAQLYAGDANTPRDSGISVSYDPRDAIFELTINRPNATVSLSNGRFQDPAHRTDFGGAREPQAGVPDLAASKNIQYLQFGSASGSQLLPSSQYYPGAGNSDYIVGARDYTSNTYTFFYQKPGTTTQYVTYAGYVHNGILAAEVEDDPNSPTYLRENYNLDRGAFVFGERTSNGNVPTSGTGTFSGDMIATMVVNPSLDNDASAPTYFQWIDGSHTTTVDFGSLAVSSDFDGKVLAPALDAYTSGAHAIAANTSFHAHSEATIDLVNKGGFTGSFTEACFASDCAGGSNALTIAGSSVDGAFFGPNGEEIGGGFRIVGGNPDERIDILGAFTGLKTDKK